MIYQEKKERKKKKYPWRASINGKEAHTHGFKYNLSWHASGSIYGLIYVNCTYITTCHTDLSTGTNGINLNATFTSWNLIYLAPCMEREDNLINFQRQNDTHKEKGRVGGPNTTLRNIEQYPVVWVNVKCQSLLEHTKSLVSKTLSCIFYTGRLLQQNCVFLLYVFIITPWSHGWMCFFSSYFFSLHIHEKQTCNLIKRRLCSQLHSNSIMALY